MLLSKYLILTPKYRGYSKRLNGVDIKVVASTNGTMASNAIALKLNLDIRDEIFAKPVLEASIKVDKDKVASPVIEASVLSNIQQVLSKELGVDLQINIVESKPTTK